MSETVELIDIGKSFGDVEILKGINAQIEKGEFIAILGESGCGKSTLLRIIAGLEDASRGAVKIAGADVSDKSAKSRDIAMVFQSYALYPHMSVAENIGFPLELSKTPKDERKRRVDEIAAMLDLTPYLDRKPKMLSGGQRQRVAMGRAMVRSPKVFLFDEPLSNLDAKLRVQMRSEIRDLQQRLGITSIYVTHDQVEALTMADRVMLLNGGRVEQFGPPLDLYERPASAFVAGFIGSPPMNLIASEVGQNGRLKLGDFWLETDRKASTGQVVLGVRPEHITLSDDGIPATVKQVERMGDRSQIRLGVGGEIITAVVPGSSPLQRDDTTHLTVNPAQIHLFDPNTGLAIQQAMLAGSETAV